MTTHDDVFDPIDTKQPLILSVYNQKGGVGKTTTSVNVAVALAALGKKVVLIDFDPQSSASSNFLFEDKANVGIHDLLNKEVFVEDAITPTSFEGLSMIVGARKLYSLEHALDGRGGSQRGLRRALHFSRNAPDYIVIDCPPALGHLAAGALAASDQLILPVFPGRYALDGLRKTLSVVEHIQKGLNPNLKIAGVLMLSVTNDEVGRESLAQLRADYSDLLFRTVVPYDVDVVKATYKRMPASVYNPKSRSTARFLALASEVVNGRGQATPDSGLTKAAERIQSWHDSSSAAYEEALQNVPASGGSGMLEKDPEAIGTKPGRRAALVAAVAGLGVGFVLGTLFGGALLNAVLAGMGS